MIANAIDVAVSFVLGPFAGWANTPTSLSFAKRSSSHVSFFESLKDGSCPIADAHL